MRKLKRYLALLLALASCLALPVTAEEGKPTAESVIADFLEENGLEELRLGIAYFNTETGEEYFYHGDDYFVQASLYKLPLSMYYADKINRGELGWDSVLSISNGATMDYLISESLVYSNNGTGYAMQQGISRSRDIYRRTIAPYQGIKRGFEDFAYYREEKCTPKQMMWTLRYLYEHSEEYEFLIDCLKQASPGEYFKTNESRYVIAQKYGYLTVFGRDINAAAIVYTGSPFLLVMLTVDLPKPNDTMSALCTRLCDYTTGQMK